MIILACPILNLLIAVGTLSGVPSVSESMKGKRTMNAFEVRITRFYFGQENVRLTVRDGVLIYEHSMVLNTSDHSVFRKRLTEREWDRLNSLIEALPLTKFRDHYVNKGVKDGKQFRFVIRHGSTEKDLYIANFYIDELGQLVRELTRHLPEDHFEFTRDQLAAEFDLNAR